MAPTTPVQVEHIRRLQLTRKAMEMFIDDPEVEEIVKGCFVRVLVDKKTKDKVYRLSEVVGITYDSKYTLGDYGKTDKHMTLQYGDQISTCKIDHISNSVFSESEFNNFVTMMNACGVPMLTEQDVLYKLRKVKTYIQLCEQDDA
uniref:Plus3 domain-containing protein n=1 Tax=Eutreptiella gymnastica TaxID=73025 RepID=A0A7S4FHQ1_9EUGL